MTFTPRHLPAAVAGVAVSATAIALAAAGPATAADRAHSSLSIRSAKAVITSSGHDTISGQLRVSGTGAAGRTVILEGRADGQRAFAARQTADTGTNGAVSFDVTPNTTTRYELVYTGDQTTAGSHSAVATVRVRPATTHPRGNTRLTVHRTVRHPSTGVTAAIAGRLYHHGHGVAGRTVVLRAKAQGQTAYTDAATAVTGTHGRVAFDVAPSTPTAYRLLFRGGPALQPSHSATVTVSQRLSSLSIRLVDSTVSTGSPAVVIGTLFSGGHALTDRAVTLEQRAGSADSWTPIATMNTGAGGTVRFSTVPPAASEDYELVFAGGPYLAGCQSGVVTVTVS